MPAMPSCAPPSNTWWRQLSSRLRSKITDGLQLQRIDFDIPSQRGAFFAQRSEPAAQ